MGADSCPAVCHIGACKGHVPMLCLRCARSFVSVAWRFFRGLFIFLPLGFWSQCDGCFSGGGGLVAGLPVGRPVGVLPPWGIIAVAAPWPRGTQPLLAIQALTSKKRFVTTHC